ncbi:DUF397 domain-containing protein [Streptomyces capitiformicae]|uniref:DUF397 domain-containing protein n=1 Tax=Streptomyces capitiformicae TaxID=2014920 RepID=A0A919L347_9ACTN|nr:DUF397 domain-containing protein [Streptomyces capitiformicae]GHH82183.1 hypothetical protein GCM10017771_05690 [Streptomyces capitiformicae]
MPTPPWQKSSYCQEGEACVHVAATSQKSSYCGQGESCVHISAAPETIHITESADPTQAVLDASPSAFGALLRALRAAHPGT